MQSKYYELKTLVEEFGNPHIFLTLTLDENDKYYLEVKKRNKEMMQAYGDKATWLKLNSQDPMPLLANFYSKARKTIQASFGKEGFFGEVVALFEKVEF